MEYHARVGIRLSGLPREIALERRRCGYRRLGIMLAREGLVMNYKKLLRLYREENLRVRRRQGRKRAMGTRAPMTLPQGPNQRWSLDFVSDTLVCSRRIRILAVVDDFTRENLALVVDTSLSGARVARELDTIIAVRGKPLMIVSDNGTELTSLAILRWSQDRQIEWHYIAPGKPQQNGYTWLILQLSSVPYFSFPAACWVKKQTPMPSRMDLTDTYAYTTP